MQRQRLTHVILFLLWCVYLLIGSLWPVWVVIADLILRVFSSPAHSLVGCLARLAISHPEPTAPGAESPASRRFADFAQLTCAAGVVALEYALNRPFAATVVGVVLAMICLTDALLGRNVFVRLRLSLTSRRWFAALANSRVTVRLDRALRRWIGAPFRDRLARRRLAMFVLSVTVSVALVFGAVKVYARSLGIRTTVWFNRENMFRPEPDLGFANQRNLKHFNYLNVWEETNDRGFKHPRPVSEKKAEGTIRIIGFGDSVMWGLGVSRDDSFMGMLDSRLGDASRYETINAGTVHYSSVQELIFFEKHLVPLKPDIVLLNLCANDIFPTDDPFTNVRGVYVRYLEDLRATEGESLSAEEIDSVEAMIDLFGAAAVWKNYQELPALTKEHAVKFLVERPYRKLIAAASRNDIRLIVLLIPSTVKNPDFINYRDRLIPLFERTGTEYIDFSETLSTEGQPAFSERFDRPDFKLPVHWPDLHSIQLYRQYEWKHKNHFFVDDGHPSRLGNRIIAEGIHAHLSDTRNVRALR